MNRIKMKRLALATFVAVALSGTNGAASAADAPTPPSIDVLLKRLGCPERLLLRANRLGQKAVRPLSRLETRTP